MAELKVLQREAAGALLCWPAYGGRFLVTSTARQARWIKEHSWLDPAMKVTAVLLIQSHRA
jgi:hypothetical protein